MNREEIENRIEICERRVNAYNEVGNTKNVHKYENEKYKWEKLLSDLDLLNEKKINELLEYKKGYYKQKEVIDKIQKIINTEIKLMGYAVNDSCLMLIQDILKEVSK